MSRLPSPPVAAEPLLVSVPEDSPEPEPTSAKQHARIGRSPCFGPLRDSAAHRNPANSRGYRTCFPCTDSGEGRATGRSPSVPSSPMLRAPTEPPVLHHSASGSRGGGAARRFPAPPTASVALTGVCNIRAAHDLIIPYFLFAADGPCGNHDTGFGVRYFCRLRCYRSRTSLDDHPPP